jgi:hypothetical protein
MHKRIKIAYLLGGACISALLFFLGGGIVLHLISDVQGIRFTWYNPLFQLFWSPAYMVFSLLIAPAIGACVAYYFGKRRGFEQPKWAIWLDAHVG